MLSDSDDIEIVGTAGSGGEGLRLVEISQPRVVLLDLQLPDMNGLEVLPMIVDRFPESRVLVLTIHDEADIVSRALRAGAAGYVLKDASQEELVSAIRIVADGAEYFSAGLVRSLLFDAEGEQVLAHLSPREVEVLRLLAEGWSNREIGNSLYLSPETIKTHVSAIFKKLDVSDRAEAVSKALRSGMIA